MTVQYVLLVWIFTLNVDEAYDHLICFFLIIDSIQCGPFVDLPTPPSKFTEGQYCYRGGPDSVCWGRSKSYGTNTDKE